MAPRLPATPATLTLGGVEATGPWRGDQVLPALYVIAGLLVVAVMVVTYVLERHPRGRPNGGSAAETAIGAAQGDLAAPSAQERI
ncbi:MAG: hypothetical protein ACQSGP_08945 [Frankia sp.]